MMDSSGGKSPGCYLLIIVGDPVQDEHKQWILNKVREGLRSWDTQLSQCDLMDVDDVCKQLIASPSTESEVIIQHSTDKLALEVLHQPQLFTLKQCFKNLLVAPTGHKHIIHAGYTFLQSGSWLIQDGLFSLRDLADLIKDDDVQAAFALNPGSIHIHTTANGQWVTSNVTKRLKCPNILLNPPPASSPVNGVDTLIDLISSVISSASPIDKMQDTDIVGNISFNKPTLYIFPGGQGDSSLFGVTGFTMLVDGGYSADPCFWNFVRHLERLDSVMITRLNENNVLGIGSFLDKKMTGSPCPQVGYMFCNAAHARDGHLDDVATTGGTTSRSGCGDDLSINVIDESRHFLSNLKDVGLHPRRCIRDGTIQPITLYHKVDSSGSNFFRWKIGHGTLDMFVLNPTGDSLQKTDFASLAGSFVKTSSVTGDTEISLPISNVMSVSCLLVWKPSDPMGSIIRILFPGSVPQPRIFDGLDKVRSLDMLHHPTCSRNSLRTRVSTKEVKVEPKSRLRSMSPSVKPTKVVTPSHLRKTPTHTVTPPSVVTSHAEKVTTRVTPASTVRPKVAIKSGASTVTSNVTKKGATPSGDALSTASPSVKVIRGKRSIIDSSGSKKSELISNKKHAPTSTPTTTTSSPITRLTSTDGERKYIRGKKPDPIVSSSGDPSPKKGVPAPDLMEPDWLKSIAGPGAIETSKSRDSLDAPSEDEPVQDRIPSILEDASEQEPPSPPAHHDDKDNDEDQEEKQEDEGEGEGEGEEGEGDDSLEKQVTEKESNEDVTDEPSPPTNEEEGEGEGGDEGEGKEEKEPSVPSGDPVESCVETQEPEEEPQEKKEHEEKEEKEEEEEEEEENKEEEEEEGKEEDEMEKGINESQSPTDDAPQPEADLSRGEEEEEEKEETGSQTQEVDEANQSPHMKEEEEDQEQEEEKEQEQQMKEEETAGDSEQNEKQEDKSTEDEHPIPMKEQRVKEEEKEEEEKEEEEEENKKEEDEEKEQELQKEMGKQEKQLDKKKKPEQELIEPEKKPTKPEEGTSPLRVEGEGEEVGEEVEEEVGGVEGKGEKAQHEPQLESKEQITVSSRKSSVTSHVSQPSVSRKQSEAKDKSEPELDGDQNQDANHSMSRDEGEADDKSSPSTQGPDSEPVTQSSELVSRKSSAHDGAGDAEGDGVGDGAGDGAHDKVESTSRKSSICLSDLPRDITTSSSSRKESMMKLEETETQVETKVVSSSSTSSPPSPPEEMEEQKGKINEPSVQDQGKDEGEEEGEVEGEDDASSPDGQKDHHPHPHDDGEGGGEGAGEEAGEEAGEGEGEGRGEESLLEGIKEEEESFDQKVEQSEQQEEREELEQKDEPKEPDGHRDDGDGDGCASQSGPRTRTDQDVTPQHQGDEGVEEGGEEGKDEGGDGEKDKVSISASPRGSVSQSPVGPTPASSSRKSSASQSGLKDGSTSPEGKPVEPVKPEESEAASKSGSKSVESIGSDVTGHEDSVAPVARMDSKSNILNEESNVSSTKRGSSDLVTSSSPKPVGSAASSRKSSTSNVPSASSPKGSAGPSSRKSSVGHEQEEVTTRSRDTSSRKPSSVKEEGASASKRASSIPPSSAVSSRKGSLAKGTSEPSPASRKSSVSDVVTTSRKSSVAEVVPTSRKSSAAEVVPTSRKSSVNQTMSQVDTSPPDEPTKVPSRKSSVISTLKESTAGSTTSSTAGSKVSDPKETAAPSSRKSSVTSTRKDSTAGSIAGSNAGSTGSNRKASNAASSTVSQAGSAVGSSRKPSVSGSQTEVEDANSGAKQGSTQSSRKGSVTADTKPEIESNKQGEEEGTDQDEGTEEEGEGGRQREEEEKGGEEGDILSEPEPSWILIQQETTSSTLDLLDSPKNRLGLKDPDPEPEPEQEPEPEPEPGDDVSGLIEEKVLTVMKEILDSSSQKGSVPPSPKGESVSQTPISSRKGSIDAAPASASASRKQSVTASSTRGSISEPKSESKSLKEESEPELIPSAAGSAKGSNQGSIQGSTQGSVQGSAPSSRKSSIQKAGEQEEGIKSSSRRGSGAAGSDVAPSSSPKQVASTSSSRKGSLTTSNVATASPKGSAPSSRKSSLGHELEEVTMRSRDPSRKPSIVKEEASAPTSRRESSVGASQPPASSSRKSSIQRGTSEPSPTSRKSSVTEVVTTSKKSSVAEVVTTSRKSSITQTKSQVDMDMETTKIPSRKSSVTSTQRKESMAGSTAGSTAGSAGSKEPVQSAEPSITDSPKVSVGPSPVGPSPLASRKSSIGLTDSPKMMGSLSTSHEDIHISPSMSVSQVGLNVLASDSPLPSPLIGSARESVVSDSQPKKEDITAITTTSTPSSPKKKSSSGHDHVPSTTPATTNDTTTGSTTDSTRKSSLIQGSPSGSQVTKNAITADSPKGTSRASIASGDVDVVSKSVVASDGEGDDNDQSHDEEKQGDEQATTTSDVEESDSRPQSVQSDQPGPSDEGDDDGDGEVDGDIIDEEPTGSEGKSFLHFSFNSEARIPSAPTKQSPAAQSDPVLSTTTLIKESPSSGDNKLVPLSVSASPSVPATLVVPMATDESNLLCPSPKGDSPDEVSEDQRTQITNSAGASPNASPSKEETSLITDEVMATTTSTSTPNSNSNPCSPDHPSSLPVSMGTKAMEPIEEGRIRSPHDMFATMADEATLMAYDLVVQEVGQRMSASNSSESDWITIQQETASTTLDLLETSPKKARDPEPSHTPVTTSTSSPGVPTPKSISSTSMVPIDVEGIKEYIEERVISEALVTVTQQEEELVSGKGLEVTGRREASMESTITTKVSMNPTQVSSSIITSSSSSESLTAPSGSVSTTQRVEDWGKPLGMPFPPIGSSSSPASRTTAGASGSSAPRAPRSSSSLGVRGTASSSSTGQGDGKSVCYVDLAYVPHHGDMHYCNASYFKRVRARYYVFSSCNPDQSVLDALIEGKQSWEDKEAIVTLIPTHETESLCLWMSANQEVLERNKIEISPSANRCTVTLQGHDSSCAAYRIEF